MERIGSRVPVAAPMLLDWVGSGRCCFRSEHWIPAGSYGLCSELAMSEMMLHEQ